MNSFYLSTFALKAHDDKYVAMMLEVIHSRLESAWHLVSFEGTQKYPFLCVVVDIDTEAGQKFWGEAPMHYLLIPFSEENKLSCEYFLGKPVRPIHLCNLLNKIAQMSKQEFHSLCFLKHRHYSLCDILFNHKPAKTPVTTTQMSPSVLATNSPSTQVENGYSTRKLPQPTLSTDCLSSESFNFKLYLADLLKNIVEQGKPSKVSLLHNQTLYYDPETHAFYLPRLERQITQSQINFLSYRKDLFKSELIDDYQLKQAIHQDKLQHYAVETILWLATFYASKGRLLPSLSMTTPIKLLSWPNITAMPINPNLLTLSAFMSKNTLSISAIAEKTQVHPSAVVDFCNACLTTGLAQLAEETRVIVPNKPLKPKAKNLFRAIMQRLALSF